MGWKNTEANTNLPCAAFESLLTLFAAAELEPAEQARVAEHLAHCASCTAEFEREKSVLALLSENHVEPDANLLAGCRASLTDALDGEEDGGWLRRAFGGLIPTSWLAPRPAWSAALLLLLGFSGGILGPRLLQRSPAKSSAAVSNAISPDSSLSASSTSNSNSSIAVTPSGAPISSLDLHTADVAGINVFPAGGNEQPQVQLQLKAQEPVTLQGTVDDGDVKRVLLYVLRNNQRYDPDYRLAAVDLLRARNSDPDVRSALCHAVHTDRNAAVRLKALEALNGTGSEDSVRETLLDALVEDQNPGVRIEAINALREMAQKGQVTSDDHLLAVLRDRVKKDPNTYIRLQSAAALQDLGPREKF
ncbi:MAG: HEAT repeat domain-containing protein [Candidatus Acidiferrales bacterium]